MTFQAQGGKARVELVPAPSEDAAVLENLLELYAHDFSEFHAIELGADGRFGYQTLPLYGATPEGTPFSPRSGAGWQGWFW
jgi:hypothetical protein